MLLVDLSKLTKDARDRIMGDYDVGVQHCKYVVLMKFAVWGQLPLVLVGIAHFDAAKAKEAAIRSLEQWHATADFEGHHEVVLELFRPGSDLRAAIESVARGTPVQSLPLLQPFIRQWSMMRVNELSVERLHKLGSLVATSAPNHSGPLVAVALRIPEVKRKLHTWSLSAWADACHSVRNENLVIREFQLEGHPALIKRRDAFALAGRKTKRCVSYAGAVRSIFYRFDLPTMFDPLSDLTAAIKGSKAKFKESLQQCVETPLGAAAAEDAADSVKTDACKCHYAWEHFKACGKKDIIYI